MRNRLFIFLVGMITGLSSCSDIFEANLEDKNLSLILPSDSITTNTYTVNFMWNEVTDAIRYKIQIVSPSFDNVQNFVLDSNITASNFNFTLNPATYQWRVRAENGSSQTKYETRTIIVKSGTLSQQPMNVSTPGEFAIVNNSLIDFSWRAIYGATNYVLQVDTINGNFTGNTMIAKTTPNTKFSLPFAEGNYRWRVQATNDTAASKHSTERTFIVDKTPPSIVSTLNYPQSVSITKPIVLTWEPATDNLSGVKKYKVYLYKGITNSTTDTTKVVLIANYDPLIVDAPATGVPTANFQYNAGQVNIFWRIRSMDAAGNESGFSSFRTFTTGY